MEFRVERRELVKAGSIAWIGTAIEWYDFFLSGLASGLVFPRVFFPGGLPTGLAIVYSFVSAYFIGYVGRPVGAFLFGHIGDRLGRRAGLFWDLILMGIGTLGIGLAPDYATAGYLGLILVMIFRFLQGMGIGGEWGGAAALMLEQAYAAGSRRRAFWAAMVHFALPVGVVGSSSALALLSIAFPGDAFYAIGWRIAYFIGAAVALVGAVIRYLVLESVLFETIRQRGMVARAPSIEVLKTQWRRVILVTFGRSVENGNGTVVLSFSPTFLQTIGISRDFALWTITITYAVSIIPILIGSLLADIYGRKRVMYANLAVALPIFIVYPYLLITKDPLIIIMAQILAWPIALGIYYGIQPAFWTEQFPTKYRYSGAGLGYHLSAIVNGGLEPIIISYLLDGAYADRWWVMSIVMVIYTIFSMLALIPLRETAKEKLE